MSFVKIFQRSRGCIMYLKFVQTDQGYQSHQLLSDLNSYRRWYWLLFKTAGNPSLKILTNMTKKTKYSFWLQKVVKNEILHLFQLLQNYLINNFFSFLIWTSFEGFIFKKVFFFNVYCENTKKWQNTVLGYK